MNIVAIRWEDFKAWRRGEKRIAPSDHRGRVYQSKIKVEITAKVIRKNGMTEIIKLT